MQLLRLSLHQLRPELLASEWVYIGPPSFRLDNVHQERGTSDLRNPFRAYRPRQREALEVCWGFDRWLRGERRTPPGHSRHRCLEAIRELPLDAVLVCSCRKSLPCHGQWIQHWWYELNRVSPERELSPLPRPRHPQPIQATLF